ncbi:MAG TPA: hypothetical protein VLJ57_18265, partial [Burkholderiaceae bacterium]|nr:hypothetical protein [Burkholderiaceae bacterium]
GQDSLQDPLTETLQADQLIGRVLGSVDLAPLLDELEHAMAEAAAGNTPDIANSPALRALQARMQARVQAEMAQAAPLIIKGLLSAMRPLLEEMQSELRELAPQPALRAKPRAIH